jgi:short-subunit dehydrogenase
MNLKNKTILIVGAGGIGLALAKELIKKEAGVILVSKTKKTPETISADFTNREELKKIIKIIKEKNKKIDVLINASGIGVYKNLEKVTEKDWDDSFAVGVTAPFILIKELLSLMQDQKSLVLNIGSGTGIIPMKGRSVYCTSKFALRGLTLSLAEEFKGKNPDFCLITLGSTLTDFGPLTLAEKVKQQKQGKAYFPVEWVADKLIEIIEKDKREAEYKLFPSEHGFGEWKKP